MIYLLYGDEKDNARAKAHELIDALQKKRPDASLFRLTSESWSPEEMERLMGGSGLFQSNYIVFLDYLSEDPEAEEFLADRAKDIGGSPNVFLVLEGRLKKATKDKLEKHSGKTQEFMAKKASEREFNNFALADAMGKRDKRELWVLFQEAANEGKAPEELHGVLFWQLKSMLAASNAKTAADSGLAPFVYSKSLRYSKNFSEDELARKSSDLVTLYHESRKGGEDLDIALEKWILNM